jgi:hypothetical protein
MGTPEGQAELETHCEPRATKFRNLFAGIGTHIPAAGIVAVVLDSLREDCDDPPTLLLSCSNHQRGGNKTQ